MDRGVNSVRPEYVPALRAEKWLALYDPLLRWTMRESTFKGRLVNQAGIRVGDRVLDLGCGTATLTLLLKNAHPDAAIRGLDGDPRILERARAKVGRAGLEIALDCGMAFALPYPDACFDHVVSSLLFHHLTHENKLRTLEETFRVLRWGGGLHVADWDKPQNSLMRAASRLVQMVDWCETTADNLEGRLPELLAQAGFKQVERSVRFMTVFGTLALHRAIKLGGQKRRVAEPRG